jgi:hypothetical protein
MRFVVKPWVKQLATWLFKNRKNLCQKDGSEGGYTGIAEAAVPDLPDGVYTCCRNMSENGIWEIIAECRKVETVAEIVLENVPGYLVVEVRR